MSLYNNQIQLSILSSYSLKEPTIRNNKSQDNLLLAPMCGPPFPFPEFKRNAIIKFFLYKSLNENNGLMDEVNNLYPRSSWGGGFCFSLRLVRQSDFINLPLIFPTIVLSGIPTCIRSKKSTYLQSLKIC